MQWTSLRTWQVSCVGTDKVSLLEVGFRILIYTQHAQEHNNTWVFCARRAQDRRERNLSYLERYSRKLLSRKGILVWKGRSCEGMRRDHLEVLSHMREIGLLQNLAYISFSAKMGSLKPYTYQTDIGDCGGLLLRRLPVIPASLCNPSPALSVIPFNPQRWLDVTFVTRLRLWLLASKCYCLLGLHMVRK